jgi:hypothetical protein
MIDPNFISQESGLNFGTVVEAIIKRSCIVDFGIVQKVVAEGIVDVSVAVSSTKQNLECMTCVLANIASSSVTVNIMPHKGDRVLVLYPRTYDSKMFDVSKGTEVLVNERARGYNIMSGIAILVNQYRKANHKNVIKVDEDSVDIEVVGGKTKMQIDSSGNVTVDTNGKYTIKNSTTDLLAVISNLNDIIKGLKTTGSETTQTISPDTVAKLVQWESSELKALLDSSST